MIRMLKTLAGILLFFSATMLFSTSCATLFTGTSDRLYFTSNPSGAKVFIDGVEMCQTPCNLNVRRSIFSKRVQFKLDGYQVRTIMLDQQFNTVSLLNFFGALEGWIVDVATGSIMEYGQKVYNVDLRLAQDLSTHNVKEIRIDTQKKQADIVLSN